jgi:hypothetical protein
MWGTGINGAEARRLRDSDDDRIKRRVYFYIQRQITDAYKKLNPYMAGLLEDNFATHAARKEPGLGPHVFIQRFQNILDPDSQDGVRIANESLDNNNFESLVVDNGYDGYTSPEQGMMVILDHDVPVQYVGLQTDIAARGNDVVMNREALFPELQATGADAVFSRRGTDAKYRPERIRNIWSTYGYNNGRVIAAIAYVDPDMFVHVTTGKRIAPEDMTPATKDMWRKADGYSVVKDGTTPLNLDALRAEIQTPFLDLEWDTTWNKYRIKDHEGRHRMSAMSDAGMKRVPVVLNFKRN